VIFPFVDSTLFQLAPKIDDYFFILTRMEPYKRVDLVADACIRAGLQLKIAGSGTLLTELRRRYQGNSNIEFLGRVSDNELPGLYAKAKAFIFPQEEDAGITPLEAMAAGTPVLAYGKGGALESVEAGLTGEFFYEQTVDALAQALTAYDWKKYDRKIIRQHVAKFDVIEFRTQMQKVIDELLGNWQFQHQDKQV
jgi:glycosyltransferase involved in cell wall biosynthesis